MSFKKAFLGKRRAIEGLHSSTLSIGSGEEIVGIHDIPYSGQLGILKRRRYFEFSNLLQLSTIQLLIGFAVNLYYQVRRNISD